MKSSFFFSTLTFVGLLMLVACGDPNPSELQAYHVSCPDSVYVYHLQQDGTECLRKKTFYAYDANGLVLSEITYASYDEAHMKPSSKIEYRSIYTMKKNKNGMYSTKYCILMMQINLQLYCCMRN